MFVNPARADRDTKQRRLILIRDKDSSVSGERIRFPAGIGRIEIDRWAFWQESKMFTDSQIKEYFKHTLRSD